MTKDNNVQLTDAQLEQVAERAAELVLKNVQLEIGRSALRALSWMAGAIMAAALAWLTHKGYITISPVELKK